MIIKKNFNTIIFILEKRYYKILTDNEYVLRMFLRHNGQNRTTVYFYFTGQPVGSFCRFSFCLEFKFLQM